MCLNMICFSDARQQQQRWIKRIKVCKCSIPFTQEVWTTLIAVEWTKEKVFASLFIGPLFLQQTRARVCAGWTNERCQAKDWWVGENSLENTNGAAEQWDRRQKFFFYCQYGCSLNKKRSESEEKTRMGMRKWARCSLCFDQWAS